MFAPLLLMSSLSDLLLVYSSPSVAAVEEESMTMKGELASFTE